MLLPSEKRCRVFTAFELGNKTAPVQPPDTVVLAHQSFTENKKILVDLVCGAFFTRLPGMNLPPSTAPSFSSPGGLLAATAALLEALPWGVLVLDAQGVIQQFNRQAAVWCGVGAGTVVGQPLATAPLPPALRAALQQLRPEASPCEVWLPGTRQWLGMRATPDPAGSQWIFWDNITACKQAEAAQQRSSQLLLDMEAVAHTGSYEADLLSGSFYFSDGLYRLFGEAPQAFEVTLDVLDARSHPDDVATVRQVLDEAIRDKQPYTYRRRIRRPDGAWRTLEAHGEVRTDATGQPVQLRGLVQDVTERVQAEQAQREGHELLQRTIDSSLDLVQVFEAVRDEQGTVVDFTWVLNNEAAERVYGDVVGQRLCERNPGVVKEGIFDTFRQVLETGVPDQREYHYAHEQFDGWFYQSTVKLGDGVTTTTHDISARKQAEQELRETKELLQATLDSSQHVVQVLKAVRDEQGTIVDFTWVLTNQAWLKQYGGPMTGKRLLRENPGVVETGLFRLFVQVTETGEPVDHEQYYAHEQFKAWFHQTLVRMGDGFVMNTIDITERKRAQEEITRLQEQIAQQATDKYQVLFNSIDEGYSLIELLYDEGGRVTDFLHLEVNPTAERLNGFERMAGRRIRELLPDVEAYWLELYESVAATGEPVRIEHHVAAQNRWFGVYASRVGGAGSRLIAAVFDDITARKQHEQRQQFLLQLNDALRPLADPLAIQRAALAVLRAHLGGTRTLYAEALDQEGTMYISTEDRDPGLVPMEGLAMRFQDFTPDGLAEAKAGRPLWRSDVRHEPHTPEQLAACATFGTRAWLMVPLVKNGRLVADLTVHSATARAWTAHDIALVQETTERTWAAVERAKAEEALRLHQQRTRRQKEAFQAAINEEPLASSLNILAQLVKEQVGREVRTAFYLAYPDGASLHAIAGAGDMPDTYTAALDGFPTGETSFCSGYAIAVGCPVHTPDVLADTAWQPYWELATAHQFRACSSYPILTREGKAIGSVALYFFGVHEATPREAAVAEAVAQAAGIILSRHAQTAERARAEEALRASEEKYRRIFENIDQGFSLHELLVDDSGRVTDVILQEVNEAFELHTGLQNAQGKKVSELVPNLEPGWLEAMTQAYKWGETQQFEAYNADTNRWLTSQYSRIGGVGSRLLSAVFTDITERKQREQHQEFLLQLSDVLRPVAGSVAMERAALHVLGETLGANRVFLATMQADGTAWSVREEYTAGLPGGPGSYPLSEFQLKRLPQWQAGHMSSVADSEADPTLSAADRAAYAAVGVRAAIGVPLVKGNRFTALLCVNQAAPRRWTAAELALTSEAAERIWVALERARAEEALAASEQRLRALIANLPGAAAFVVGPDLRYQLAGGEALGAAGIGPADLLGRTVAEAMPPELVAPYEAHYRQALAGQDFSLEHTAHGRTFISRGVPLLGAAGQPAAVLVVSYDITARKQAEEALHASQAQLAELNTQLEQRVARRTQQLQTSRDLLQSVFDTSLVSMSVLYAVRDEAGQVQDFRLGLVNKKLERETGRTDLVGKLYAQEYPGIRQAGLFDLMLRALATNEPQTLEYFYDREGFNRWYTCQFVKMGDGVVATNLDITERKLAEQERLKNLRLLEQAEAVAGLGSWDYDLATSAMRWSDGMYHLVHLPLGQPISPEVYLQLVEEGDRPRAEQLVRQLTSGQNVEETLRLRVGEHVKTVRLKAVVLRDEAGQPARVLGVDLDISELQRLEADNLRLRLGQQQALFEAVQEAQEAERKRIAEGLHNGIGQILYATKLQLDRLPAEASNSPRHRAAQLLGEAIRQTRALSHELTPAILEEFGLEATLRSMCSTLSTPALRWHCHLVLDDSPALPPALQLAVYRLAQELAQNVLKHAHATAATLEVEVLPAWVVLRVEDNGRGFDPAQTSDGLGLRTLRSRAALLGGSVQVATAPGGGTQCQVRLPLPTTF
jgi:PAS domain S-box-containing protein